MWLKKFKNYLVVNRFKLLVYIALLCTGVVIYIMFHFSENMSKVTIENHSFYQYFSGNKFEYDGSISLNENNSITKLMFDDVTIELDSTPIYYKDVKRVLFPKKMSVVYPLSNVSQYKVNGYTYINTDGLSFTLTDGSLNKDMQNCFLYDGNDLYFFLEETEIYYNDKNIKLMPFSYIIVKYNTQIEIYDYSHDKYEIIDIDKKDVYAKNSNYELNLSIDALKNQEKSRLLIRKIDFLGNLK